MSFLEHLDELRTRLTISAIAVVVGFLIAFAFSSYVFDFIMKPLQAALPPGGKLIYTDPAEAFLLYLKISALAGTVIAAPVVIWQLWLFIAPGLYQHEKRYAIPFVLISSFFFVCGAAFSHFLVFPFAWRFFASFNTDYVQFMPRIAPAFSLYSKLMLAMGAVFQMPTLVFFLARMGVVTGRQLLHYTKYAILIIFIVAAIITPGPDVVSQCLVAAPMLMLYAVSILIAWAFGKRRTADVDSTPEAHQ
jgi:sec-independent protein translocase protein TatC